MIEDLLGKRTQELLSLRSYFKGKLKGVQESIDSIEWKRKGFERDLAEIEGELTRRKAG